MTQLLTLLPIASTIVLSLAVLINIKRVSKVKYKDVQVDFTNFKSIKQHGETDDLEKLRMLLLKQLLFTQEFVNRFQPLLSTLVYTCKQDEENQLTDKYPSLKNSEMALQRFRDLLRNTKFDYVINWDCPIYDKVGSGYRDNYIQNIGRLNKDNELYIPNLIDDCKNKTSIDLREGETLEGYSAVKSRLDNTVDTLENLMNNHIDTEFDAIETEGSRTLTQLKEQIAVIEDFIGKSKDKEILLNSRYNYTMDISNSLYESILYWNEKTPEILASQTSALLYVLYQDLSTWLIRNDLPLSQVKLEQYLDIHAENLVARLNEELLKQIPNFRKSIWKKALEEIGETDLNVNNYFRLGLKDWITGVQQVRFGLNIFIGTEDYI